MSELSSDRGHSACARCGALSPFAPNRVKALCDECRAEAERVRVESEELFVEAGASAETIAAAADIALLREGK